MANVNITADNMKLAKAYAKTKDGMSIADSINHLFYRGYKRQEALDKHRSGAPKKATKKAKKVAKKRPLKKAAAKKTKKATKGKGGKVPDAQLLKMKKDGMSNPQIAKQTGMSKDQVFRAIKRAQK